MTSGHRCTSLTTMSMLTFTSKCCRTMLFRCSPSTQSCRSSSMTMHAPILPESPLHVVSRRTTSLCCHGRLCHQTWLPSHLGRAGTPCHPWKTSADSPRLEARPGPGVGSTTASGTSEPCLLHEEALPSMHWSKWRTHAVLVNANLTCSSLCIFLLSPCELNIRFEIYSLRFSIKCRVLFVEQ